MRSNDPRIRVVFGVNDFLVGGAQMLLVEQLARIDRKRFDVALVILKEFPEERTLLHRLPAGLTLYRPGFYGIRSFGAWFRLYRLLKAARPQVVVSHLFFANTVFRVLSFLLPYRTISVEHNTYIYKKGREILADRLLAARSARMVAVSRTVAAYAARQARLPESRFTVIPNGIDVEGLMRGASSKEASRARLGLPDGRIFLTVARLAYQKNHACLIDGFTRYVAAGGDGTLVIVGDGPLRGALEGQIRAGGMETRIRLPGLQRAIVPWYRAADVFVSVSAIEGFSYAHLEAAAAGLPLISTKTAGADELIEDAVNGLFVPFDDPEALARALGSLTAEKITRWGEASKRRISAFDICRNVQEYETLITAALHDRL